MIWVNAISGCFGAGKPRITATQKSPIRSGGTELARPIREIGAVIRIQSTLGCAIRNDTPDSDLSLPREDPFVGIDLDDCLDSAGNPKGWAQGIVERFSDTYVEISPSGLGLKIWAKGRLPGNVAGVKVGDGCIGIYDRSRYFSVTGCVFRGSPLEVEDHAADLISLDERLAGATQKRWSLQPLEGGRIPYGQQHNTLVSIAGRLRARRVCDEAIDVCLQVVNERQCEKPGPRVHISEIVRSSRKWGATA